MSDETLWLDAIVPGAAMARLTAQAGAAAAAGAQALSLGGSPMVTQSIAELVGSSLHLDLLALFAEGWASAAKIRDYRDAKKHPAGTLAVLKLGAHSIKREVKPVIVIDLGGAHRFPVDVAIEIKGSFRGIELSIQDSEITAVGSGTCDIGVEPKLAGVAVCEPIILKSWKLPGRRVFKTPIKIP